MHINNEDTITALATPAGEGAIAVIRLSGDKSFEAVDKIFHSGKKISECNTHTINYGKIINSNNEIIDDVLVSVFRKPNSYTGEDSVEISIHGSQLIAKKIIAELLKHEIRLAEPGEFTKRAFLNGKLDLAQAEAVADVIHSRSEASLRGSRNQLDGILSSKVKTLREELLNISSLIELELDFSEEDIELIAKKDIQSRIEKLEFEIKSLLETYKFGKVIHDGVNVAIIGKPNAGKSSLLNYLLKENRAIVSEIPGTTRDIIREQVTIDGILFFLFDTAGMRHSTDEIEKEGVRRSQEAIKNADLILMLFDSTEDFPKEIYDQAVSFSDSGKIICVSNKIDISGKIHPQADCSISAKTGEGIEKLFDLMKNRAVGNINFTEKNAIVTNLRHVNALKKAAEYLSLSADSLANNLSGEFVTLDLRNAAGQLEEIIGLVTNEDILNNIFSKFCIGK
jgi:tRNA modification GTPase